MVIYSQRYERDSYYGINKMAKSRFTVITLYHLLAYLLNHPTLSGNYYFVHSVITAIMMLKGLQTNSLNLETALNGCHFSISTQITIGGIQSPMI